MMHESDYAVLNALQAERLELDMQRYDFSGANNYQREAVRTLQPNVDIVYLAGKLAVESAEALQVVLKARYHGKAGWSQAEWLDELGDVAWYLACLAHELSFDLSRVMEENIIKLRARHGTQYNQSYYVPDAGKESEQ